ncbi:sulfite exporter TauE/SafE family protein [Larkinella sp. VNQ87]|uniref:sulfite exporter TauE/SafE family protein n=1 Tax=Larkinella sp. VNQ87 TaxID=3400921 RepID=UPI003BFC3584
MNGWYFTALLAGLAGSLHCVGMCGPLAMALPVGRLTVYQRFPAVLLYHAGRVSAYGLLGLVVGLTGQGLLLAGLQRPISIACGVLLLIWPLTNQKHSLLPASSFLKRLTSPLTHLLRQPSFMNFGVAGFFNGLLPCGFVYVALAGALAQSSAVEGGSYMVLFGLGTLPALLGIRFIPDLFPVSLRQRFSRAFPVLTIVLALLLIGRGLFSYVPDTTQNAPSVPICHGGR